MTNNTILEKEIAVLENYITTERKAKIESVLKHRTKKLTVVLENVFHEHNISAVMRTLDCFGVQDLHLIENNSQLQTSKRISRGSNKWLSIQRYNGEQLNSTSAINNLKKQNYKILATAPPHTGAVSIDKIEVTTPIALVMGAEKAGISNEVIELADELVYLPMNGFTESYNVSVAAALALYELIKKVKETSDWDLTNEEKLKLKNTWYKNSVRDWEYLMAQNKAGT